MVAGQQNKMNFLKKIYYEKYTKKSYSFNNVDLIIDYLLKDIENGIYIDLGCNHPIKFNNTYLLYKRGWSGINIDSDKISIDLFNKFRKNDFNVNKIVSENEDLKKLYIYHDRSTINTLDKELVNSRTKKPISEIEEKSTTLNKIIEKSPFEKDKINLLTVDIEGHEFQALKNFNFSKYKIDVVVLELFDKSLSKIEMFNQSIDFVTKSRIYNLLLNNNYKLINWVHSDLIFVRNDFPN
tara:strand:- start:2249 stop:2965 length:717 start_codon:yes stop_codon:yes gene_type:complete